MSDSDLDRRLGALLREGEPPADQAFVDNVVAAARLDREIQRTRRLARRRALAECAGAIAVAATFFLLSQEQGSSPDGIMSLYGSAMAGLVMLGLWATVSLPISAGRAPAA